MNAHKRDDGRLLTKMDHEFKQFNSEATVPKTCRCSTRQHFPIGEEGRRSRILNLCRWIRRKTIRSLPQFPSQWYANFARCLVIQLRSVAVFRKFNEFLSNALSASKEVIQRISVGETLRAVFVVVKATKLLPVIRIRAVRATVAEVVGTCAEPCYVGVETAGNCTRSS